MVEMASIIDLSDNMTSPPDPSTSSRSSYGQDDDIPSFQDMGFSKVLGREWSTENVMNLAANSTKVYHIRLLNTIALRELEVVEGFLESGVSTQLSGKHLYGVLLYTRGNQENKIPCTRCKTPGKRIFPKCISLSTMASGACAADVWFGTNKDCHHHTDNTSKVNHDIDSEDDVIVTNTRRLSGRIGAVLPIKQQSSITPPQSTRQNCFGSSQFFSHAKVEKISRDISSDGNDTTGNISTSHNSIDVSDAFRKSSGKKITKRLIPKPYSSIIVNGKQFTTPSSIVSNVSAKRQHEFENHAIDEQPPPCRPRSNHPIRDTLDYLHGDFDYGATELLLEITPDMIAEATSTNMIRVGMYLLSRFRVETNVMWAVRVAAARWAHGVN